MMSTSGNPDVAVEVYQSLLCPVRHCPHHGPGPLLPPLCPHSYTAQLPPLDPPEATTSVVRLNKFKPFMQWRGYKPTTLSSEGICAYTQPLLVERLNLSSRIIHAVMGFEPTTLSSEGIGARLSMHDHCYLDHQAPCKRFLHASCYGLNTTCSSSDEIRRPGKKQVCGWICFTK